MGKFCLSDRLLNKAAVIFVVSLLLLQIFLIQNAGEFTRNQDQLTYLKFASENVENSSWYPSEINVLNNYSFAPGYVNMLILFHKIFGTFSGFSYLNVVLSAILLLEIYIVAKKLFSARVAAFAVLLYCLTYSNWFLPIGYFSDLPFVLFAFTALTICVACKDWRWLLFSGIFLSAANWIRPLAIAYFAGCVLFILAERVAVWRKILFLSACTLASILAIGFLTKLNCGVFSFQSTTSGVNLAGSANFKANGLVSFLFDKDPFYIQRMPADWKSLNFKQRDSVLRNIAKEWIIENPVRYISQIPLKSAVLFGFDTWSERYEGIKGLSAIRDGNKSKDYIVKYCIGLWFKSIVFYASLLLFAIYVWKARAKCFSRENILLFVPFMAAAITIPFMVTDRYHYPLMPLIWIFAACALAILTKKYFCAPDGASDKKQTAE